MNCSDNENWVYQLRVDNLNFSTVESLKTSHELTFQALALCRQSTNLIIFYKSPTNTASQFLLKLFPSLYCSYNGFPAIPVCFSSSFCFKNIGFLIFLGFGHTFPAMFVLGFFIQSSTDFNPLPPSTPFTYLFYTGHRYLSGVSY